MDINLITRKNYCTLTCYYFMLTAAPKGLQSLGQSIYGFFLPLAPTFHDLAR